MKDLKRQGVPSLKHPKLAHTIHGGEERKKKKQPLDIEKVFQIIGGVGQDNQTHLQKVIFILFLFTWLNKAENPNRFSDLFLLSFLLSANIY